MSVVVDHITKIYGTQRAVDDISFEAKRGEILGLLGPNGAGKSTTMKMLTCFLDPTEGTASVNGHDILTAPNEVRRNIGYLAEHNPIYPEMYVKEFLEIVARIFKITAPQQRIAEIIEMTGLGLEQHKPIGALSKGYRQRVGLAQALIHDPEVLILDEPTSGLDPNQLAEIRQLIRGLGQSKTVIFSSHILQEVQALCDRVVILNHGKIVANDSIGNLAQTDGKKRMLEVQFLKAFDQSLLQSTFGESRIKAISTTKFEIESPVELDLRESIFDLAVAQQNKILAMSQEEASVEDVFQQLTTKKKETEGDA